MVKLNRKERFEDVVQLDLLLVTSDQVVLACSFLINPKMMKWMMTSCRYHTVRPITKLTTKLRSSLTRVHTLTCSIAVRRQLSPVSIVTTIPRPAFLTQRMVWYKIDILCWIYSSAFPNKFVFDYKSGSYILKT